MKLYWLNLETEGLDPEKDAVLEIAVSVADLENPFDAAPIYHAVIDRHRDYSRLPERVLQMHTRSGLLEECAGQAARKRRFAGGPWEVEEELLAIVSQVEDPEERPVLAGSSVHFDAAFLRADFPALHARFSHRHYDVSAVKLFCRSLGMLKLPKAEAHRAREDVLESIAHARECARWLANAPNAMRWWPMCDPKAAR